MNEYTNIFQSYLKENGLKLTSQRKLVLDVFISLRQRLTADELFKEVVRIDPTVSLSTIYRAVKHLHHSGVARSVQLDDGTMRYEPVDGLGVCMICEACGKKVHATNPYLDCMHRETARQRGFEMHQCQMTIYGTCHECLKERNTN